MPNAGYIYVVFNPEMPDCLKVGRTDRSPQQRVTELSGTSVPVPFRLLMQWQVIDTVAAEKAAHAALAEYRVAPNREFFRIDGPEAVLAVGRAIAAYIANDDGALRHEIAKACADVAQALFTRDYRSLPPTKVSPEITEALQAEIFDRTLWLSQLATEDGAPSTAMMPVIELMTAYLMGFPQTRRSPAELARDFNDGVDVLMSLLSTSFYEQVGVAPFAAPALRYAADIANVVAHAMQRQDCDQETD